MKPDNAFSILILLFTAFFLLSCGDNLPVGNYGEGRMWDAPSNPTPAEGAIGRLNNTKLEWHCTNPDGDSLRYSVYLGTSNRKNSLKFIERVSVNSFMLDSLSYSRTYYWKIIVSDDHRRSVTGPVWSFRTAHEDNHPPDDITNFKPIDGAINQPIDRNLYWSCEDPDENELTFDIYLGEPDDTLPFAEDQHCRLNGEMYCFDPGPLTGNTQYYWKVIARDGAGGVTEGLEWEFSVIDAISIEREFELADRVNIEMVWIPAGFYKMGSTSANEPGAKADEIPSHNVIIENGFWMGKYEVTQSQWEDVMGSNPSYGNILKPDHPVNQISYNDIPAFLESVNDGFRLPSEAEWEYACRAGTNTRFYWGDDPFFDENTTYAWYAGNSGDHINAVGQKLPNAHGLFDMIGNVVEWCEDDYHDNYQGAPEYGFPWIDDPRTVYRVLRGGWWSSEAVNCQAANRDRDFPNRRESNYGLRLVLDL